MTCKKRKHKKITRTENMSRIKAKETSIEIKLRKELWHRGYRYQKNCKDVYGKPDICFKGKKVAIFCDSEFWHGKNLIMDKYTPKTNTDFWKNKIGKNIQRDKIVNDFLEKNGWKVLRFWGNDIKNNTAECIKTIENVLNAH